MTKQAILLQDTAVDKIINLLHGKDEVTFKAPTGSGKTVMIAKLMSKLLESDKNLVFFVSSLSKCELAEQNDNTFQEFKRFLKNLNPYLIDSSSSTEQSGVVIEYNHNVYTIPRDLTRKGGKIMSGPLNALIYNIILQNKKIILIKDECHQAQNNIDAIADNHKFYKKINLSATPQTSKFNIDVEITENEAIEAKLIKPYQIKGRGNGYQIDKYAELNESITIFKELRSQYQTLFNINPCLLIQIPNSAKGEEELAHLKHFLNKEDMQIK
jgi:type III restriction enzyme